MSIFNNADFAITKVKEHKKGTAIEEVKMGWVKEKKVPETVYTFSRGEVIEKLDDGKVVVTWNEGKSIGNRVNRFPKEGTINGKVYIRTDEDETEEDNLGDLPTYK